MGTRPGDESVEPQNHFFKALRDPSNPDEDTNHIMAVDASSSEKRFRVTCPAGRVVIIERFCFSLLDTAAQPSKFGAVALTNGIEFNAYNAAGELTIKYLDGIKIKNTSGMALLAGVDAIVTAAAGPDDIPFRWSIFLSGRAMKLRENCYFEAILNDNFSGMDFFAIMAQGYYDF